MLVENLQNLQERSELMRDEAHPWLIYALGSGWGHLNRAVALGRAVAPYRPVYILTNSPYAERVQHWLQQRSHSEWIPMLYRIPAGLKMAIVHQIVQTILLQPRYHCLIVDTFPRGLTGELVDILPQLGSIPRILIHRDLNPDYVSTKCISSFVEQWYDAVLIPGEGEDVPLAGLPNVIHTLPWLIYRADELPNVAEIRQSLNLPQSFANLVLPCQSPPAIFVCAAGPESELEFFGHFTVRLIHSFPHMTVRCLAPVCPPTCPPHVWISHYPAMEYLSIADVVVGGAGYNTVYECAALHVPLVCFAFPRLYDRQMHRARHAEYWAQTESDAIAAVHAILTQRTPRSLTEKLLYENGTQAAAQQIHQIYQRRVR